MMRTDEESKGSPSHLKHPLTDDQVKKGHCTHGPNGKCVNCLDVTKDTAKFIKHQCNHPVGQKCPNCPEAKTLIEGKHESIENYLLEMKKKCKGSHRPDQRC
jgi:hypothetical protein